MLRGTRAEVVWAPQTGPQAALLKCPVDEIFFGGARGGGKTDGMLGKFAAKASRYGEHAIGVFFRRSREDLKEAIERSKAIYGMAGARWLDQKKWWVFPNGARLKFEYLDKDSDADNYQGHNYTDVFFEELTQWADPKPVNKLRATLRSAAGVPCQFHATGNPGGPGHGWVKARYIDPAPLGWDIQYEDFTNPFTGEVARKSRVFIPSRVSDNRFLGTGYIANLFQSGSGNLVKAWLEGDWSVIDGAFFDCWRAHHVLRPFAIPKDWLRFRSMDWGSASPFSVGWWAVASDDFEGPSGIIPRGALVRYREWYGDLDGEPGVGLKLSNTEVARTIKAKEAGETISYGVLDPSAFIQQGGPSIAEQYAAEKVFFRRADNSRVVGRGAMSGWDQMRGRLVGFGGRPMLYTFATCTDSIRTIPVLQHDPDRAEDLDTTAEDHAADEWRYACMSRPWIPAGQPERLPDDVGVLTALPDGRVISKLSVREIIELKQKRRERD